MHWWSGGPGERIQHKETSGRNAIASSATELLEVLLLASATRIELCFTYFCKGSQCCKDTCLLKSQAGPLCLIFVFLSNCNSWCFVQSITKFHNSSFRIEKVLSCPCEMLWDCLMNNCYCHSISESLCKRCCFNASLNMTLLNYVLHYRPTLHTFTYTVLSTPTK